MKGSCLCKRIRYELTSQPVGQFVCHCKNCQRQSGSAFSAMVAVPTDALQITGDLTSYIDKGDSGNEVHRFFCGTCGSPIYSATPANPGMVVVKAGTLDDTNAVAPNVHLWCDSAWAWTPFREKAIKIAKNPPPR